MIRLGEHFPKIDESMDRKIRPDPRAKRNVMLGLAVFFLSLCPILVAGAYMYMTGSISAVAGVAALLATALGVFVGFGIAAWPVLFFRCPECGNRISRVTRRPLNGQGNQQNAEASFWGAYSIHYYCPTCDIEWETGWTSTPGGGD